MHRLLSNLIAPHYCSSCGRIGEVLCENCKYDITSEPFDGCLVCRMPTSRNTMLCSNCTTPYSRAWCVGERRDALERLIDSHKFEHLKDAYESFASLLDDIVPALPSGVTVVPVPTISAHIRQRGYDHTALLARRFARLRSCEYASPLERRTNHVQRGGTKRERQDQAKDAFASTPLLGGVYLLIDDVFTTGATVASAAAELRRAGATDVWVAVIARQPLEK